MHRVRLGHVAADLLPHALLSAGQLPGQPGAQPGDQIAARVEREPARASDTRSQYGKPQLQEQSFVEREPTAGRRQRRVGLGKVRVLDRLRQADEAPARAHTLRQHLVHLGGVRFDEPPHEGAERALGQPFRERVHRHEPAGVQTLVLAVLDDLVVRLLDDDRALVAPDTTVQDELLAALEHAREIPPAEPARGGVAARVAQHHREGHPRASGRRRAHPDDHARARRGLAGHQRAERGQPRAVLVAERDEEERVLDGPKPLALELARALRADALDELKRRPQIRRRVGLRHDRPCAIQCPRLGPLKLDSREHKWLSAVTSAEKAPPSAIRSAMLTS